MEFDFPARGMVALAIPAEVTTRLQTKLYGGGPSLGDASHATAAAPFSTVHARLPRAGRGLDQRLRILGPHRP